MSGRKFGEGSLKAALRQGHKEIGKALPAFADSIQPVEEPGAFNNPTSYEVSKQTGAVESKEDHVYGQLEAVDKNRSLKSQLVSTVHGKEDAGRDAAYEPDMEPEPEP